jgi:hypothetical protein
MNMRIVTLLTFMAVIPGLSGCVTIPEEHEGAAKGSGIGAVAGAVGGALIAGEGSRTKGAIIGGLAGALIGGVIGNYTVDQKKSAAETTNKYNYQSSAGTVVRIEGASARPTTVNPGGKVDLDATYAVMAPSPNTPVSITETREVRLNNELVGSPEVTVSHTAGTYTSSVPLFLPADANKGTYRVLVTIRTDAGRDSRETSFIVN